MKKTVFGAGAALVDLLVEESEEFLDSLGSPKGGMTMVELDFISNALEKSGREALRVPGGSACNTLVGLARLGGDSRFLGNIGPDKIGAFFEDGLRRANVQALLSQSETGTGQVLSVVTPDAQRTMFTYLGASAELAAYDLESTDFSDLRLLHTEGYLAFNRDYFKAVFSKARESGAGICLDLSSFEVVRFCREILTESLKEGVEILIANEDEAREFAGSDDREVILSAMSKVAPIAVYKLGAKGVIIRTLDGDIEVPTTEVKAVDTTGAGDLWAAGFLYGYTEGWSIEQAARLGNAVAGEVVKVMGAVIPDDVWSELLKLRDEIRPVL